jgi:hypothetical protein
MSSHGVDDLPGIVQLITPKKKDPVPIDRYQGDGLYPKFKKKILASE